MVNWAGIAGSAFNAFEKVNSTVAFYMFIIEEAIQTVSMAVYLSYKAWREAAEWGEEPDLIEELRQKLRELAQWNKSELIEPLKDFTDDVGYLGFPMNLAFRKFAEASEKAMDYYLSIS